MKLHTHQSQELENATGDTSINSVEQDFSHCSRYTVTPKKGVKISIRNDFDSKFKSNCVDIGTNQ